MDKPTEIKHLLEVTNLKTWFPIKRGVLSKTVGYIRAVDGVSFYLDSGETLGLVGESGCGKTTLGRTILGLEKASEGLALFDDKDLLSISRQEIRGLKRRMQIIFQDPLSSLNPRMNVFDIITEGLSEYNLIKGSREEHAIKLLNDVGLNQSALYRYPHEFSGGQRQRISIARAISLKPDFIVCDEPVSALDVSVQAQVVNLLMDLRDKYNLSYLFISHDLSIVSHIANRVAVMYLGRIVEEGATEEIIRNPVHPYTKGLIDSVPAKGKNRTKKILKGQAPSPSNPPSGCVFHPRCQDAKSICTTIIPKESKIGSRRVSCHLIN